MTNFYWQIHTQMAIWLMYNYSAKVYYWLYKSQWVIWYVLAKIPIQWPLDSITCHDIKYDTSIGQQQQEGKADMMGW